MGVLSFIYRTNQAINSCQEEVLFAEPSKVIFSNKDTDNVKSLNWTFSKRVNFLVSSENLYVGKMVIQRKSIEKVSHYEFIANIMPIKYVVLKIHLNDDKFLYVGCNKNTDLLEELSAIPFSIQQKNRAFYFLWAAIVVMLIYYFTK